MPSGRCPSFPSWFSPWEPRKRRPDPPRTPFPRIPKVTTGTLENGLRYYIRANDQPEDRAELRLVVNAGSILEDENQLGLAHFVEAYGLQTERQTSRSRELVNYLESIGMAFGPEINASTSFDETVYMLQIPTDDPEIMATAFQILEDWAHQISFEGEEIDKERGVIIEEWRFWAGGAGARMLDKQFPILFQGIQVRRAPSHMGAWRYWESFPYEALTKFYHDWYPAGSHGRGGRGVIFDAQAGGGLCPGTLLRHRRPREPTSPCDLPRPGARGDPLRHRHRRRGHQQPGWPSCTNSPWRRRERSRPTGRAWWRDSTTGSSTTRLYRTDPAGRSPPSPSEGAGQGRMVRSGEIFQLAAMVQGGGIERGDGGTPDGGRSGRPATAVHRHRTGSARRPTSSVPSSRPMRNGENQDSRSYASEYVRNFLGG